MLKIRYLQPFIAGDLRKKMVFIGGPRQVGKTTLARMAGVGANLSAQYLNWDSRPDRKKIIEQKFNGEANLLIFDELHKYRQWKNYIKGLYDTASDRWRILVTGSARLDLYRRGGDSLLGRYRYYRLHPFSVAELAGNLFGAEPGGELVFKNSTKIDSAFADLLAWGGFPEPLLAKDTRALRRWHNERLDRLIKEDIRDIEMVRDLSGLEVLGEILPAKAGSLLSLNSLREDLGVAHKTVALWVDILERFYYHFRIYPFQSTAIKSLRKEPKLYLWDWSELADPGKRLENLVASHLLKFVHWLEDAHGYRAELFYLRDTEGRETDFLVTIKRKPWFAVEVKNSDDKVSPALDYFRRRLKIPYAYQVTGESGKDFMQNNIRVISADKFLSALV